MCLLSAKYFKWFLFHLLPKSRISLSPPNNLITYIIKIICCRSGNGLTQGEYNLPMVLWWVSQNLNRAAWLWIPNWTLCVMVGPTKEEICYWTPGDVPGSRALGGSSADVSRTQFSYNNVYNNVFVSLVFVFNEMMYINTIAYFQVSLQYRWLLSNGVWIWLRSPSSLA